jgi:hypothetical protein
MLSMYLVRIWLITGELGHRSVEELRSRCPYGPSTEFWTYTLSKNSATESIGFVNFQSGCLKDLCGNVYLISAEKDRLEFQVGEATLNLKNDLPNQRWVGHWKITKAPEVCGHAVALIVPSYDLEMLFAPLPESN